MVRYWHFALFRAFTALIFIYAGFKHIAHGDKVMGRIQQCSLFHLYPSQSLFNSLVVVSGIVMMVAALFLLAGKFQKWSAAILLLVLIGITFTVQLENLDDLGPFFKNVAIAGSLIFLFKNNDYVYKKT